MDFNPMAKTMDPAVIRSRFHRTFDITRWYSHFFIAGFLGEIVATRVPALQHARAGPFTEGLGKNGNNNDP
jgi:hypothetical protein